MCDGELKFSRFNYSYQLFFITTEKVNLTLWAEIFPCYTSAVVSFSSWDSVASEKSMRFAHDKYIYKCSFNSLELHPQENWQEHSPNFALDEPLKVKIIKEAIRLLEKMKQILKHTLQGKVSHFSLQRHFLALDMLSSLPDPTTPKPWRLQAHRYSQK